MQTPHPEARPRTRRRLSEDARRTQIVGATVTVIAELGYENATLARIAERADVSKGLVSHYFTDRDGLMETVARTTLAAMRQTVADSLALDDPVPDVVRAAIHRAAGLGTTHRAELAALRQIITSLRHADGTPRLGPADYEETYRGQEALFRRGQEDGTLRDFDTRVMAVTYQGAVDTMLTHLHAHPETDAHRYADALADLVVAAISAHRRAT
ncbi:TetR family transcriptional regulator [Streptomyces olivaceus]|uniref:TetR family transcriptional regulator n=1 Tax=Streptomyces olivaceus TaxID=47716 RepID=UPI0036E0AB5D